MTAIEIHRLTKRVSFCPHVCVKRTLHINEFSGDEIQAVWYNERDFDQIRKDIRITVQGMLRDQSMNDDHYCSRGLECRTHEGMKSRLRNRVAARCAVFREQNSQSKNGYYDVDKISAVYKTVTNHCVETAHVIGALDEQTVLGVRGYDVHDRKRKHMKNHSILCPLIATNLERR